MNNPLSLQELLLELTEKELLDLAAKWQTVLRLDDWDIALDMTRHYRCDVQRYAEVSINALARRAFIRVVNPADFPKEMLSEWDIENTIVHELTHIILEPAVKKYVSEQTHETATEQLALAYTDLLRFRPDLKPEISNLTKPRKTYHEKTHISIIPIAPSVVPDFVPTVWPTESQAESVG
jgi:hypothetical protein